jgi:alpha-glucosidase
MNCPEFVSRVAAQPAPEPDTPDWWRGAAIYQVYPRSFADSDGNGVGDLPGITARLDYVARLGVDAVWLSPFFRSPMRDFGYDVSDYCAVDPLFGTLADFDALAARARALGLKLIVDQVYSHTSDEHPWFAESRADRNNARADWYVWADAKPDGSPPNNWQSVFGGPAWTWDARRGQYYLHNFLPSQPQLNNHRADVQDALIAVSRFWRARGVDGFRVDAINFAMHDPALRDNPPRAPDGRPRTRPFDFQEQRYNQSHPDIARFVERLRAANPDAFFVAEVGGLNALAEMHAFTAGDGRFQSAYGFDFLYAPKLTPMLVAEALDAWPDAPGTGWPSWAFENHDAPRAVSRWAEPGHEAAFARMKALLLACLRGTVIVYQGEELGLEQVDVPFEALRDPEAIANWPLTLSRDGARTPMPWDCAAPGMGFTTGTPWLPLGEAHRHLAVAAQERERDSVLNVTRRVLELRRTHPALRTGSSRVLAADERVLLLERADKAERLLCAFNCAPEPAPAPPELADATPLLSLNGADVKALPPYAALLARQD